MRPDTISRPTAEAGSRAASAAGNDEALLRVRNLSVQFNVGRSRLVAVDGVDLEIGRGEVLGIVGESGSGKSMTMLALARLVPQATGVVTADEINLAGDDLLGRSEREMQQIRGRRIGFIFQNPLSSLNPLLTIGEQIAETVARHLGLPRRAARDRTADLLDRVGIPAARSRLDDYPHQFSGGMRQRVMIAMAIACDPWLILADEPTTALDVTIQAQILDLLRAIVEESGTAIILVTHDLGIAASLCRRVSVMYAGQIVETAPVEAIFGAPLMPYTWGLIDSIPRFDQEPGSTLPMLPGVPPDPMRLASGCRFAERCAYRRAQCAAGMPPLTMRGPAGHVARCIGTDAGGWLEVQS
jgi:oligopeptide/dipeptide ABC transporter ATP-binding protein